ncbi:MAG TPA: PilZ domain-containing protein [Candidatus Acidoferrum sp.]|nr:PilZ domain-containing protein [Candidatus Acidoferrum sp.]
MNSIERRMSPRKLFAAPIRFRFLSEQVAASIGVVKPGAAAAATRSAVASVDQFEGEAIDISERGVCFLSGEKIEVGEAVEMLFTLPRDLTGRNTEDVRCNARVVHVDKVGQNGAWKVGAYVESYKPLQSYRTWDN